MPRALGNAASTRISSGASASCFSSQLKRAFSLPSRGASIATLVVVCRDRRSVRISSGPTASGIRSVERISPGFDQRPDRFVEARCHALGAWSLSDD